MKYKMWWGISLCLSIVGLILCFYCMFCENESSCFLALALLCITIGNFINIEVHKKQKKID